MSRLNKKVDYNTYECTDSDPYEIIDTDSDPDSIIANHIADYRLYYQNSEESDKIYYQSSSESDQIKSDCSDSESEFYIGDYKMRCSSSSDICECCWPEILNPSEYLSEDEEPERTPDEIWCSLISIDEIELCLNKACLK
jgi:hypothetical protein